MNLLIQDDTAFTLIELIMVIVILGILGAYATIKIDGTIENAKIQATKQELKVMKDAMVGDPESTVGGQIAEKGYYGDVGALPPQSSGASVLEGLVTQPGGVSDWDRFTQTGWNGPYIDDDPDDEWRIDAWGNYYVYSEANGTITSNGPDGTNGTGDDITILLNK